MRCRCGASCLHIVCHCQLKAPSSLVLFKSRLVLPFWYWLTQVVLEKRLLNRCNSSSGSGSGGGGSGSGSGVVIMLWV